MFNALDRTVTNAGTFISLLGYLDPRDIPVDLVSLLLQERNATQEFERMSDNEGPRDRHKSSYIDRIMRVWTEAWIIEKRVNVVGEADEGKALCRLQQIPGVKAKPYR